MRGRLLLVALLLAGLASLPGSAATAPVSCSVPDRWFDEGDSGVYRPSFQATCNGPLPQTFTFRYTTADGTAVAPGDYEPWDDTAGAFAGQSFLELVVGVVGDTEREEDETFTVTVTDPTGTVTFTKPTATITILDDDGPPRPPTVCTVPDSSFVEGSSGGLALFTFAITCDPLVTKDVSFRVTTADGTAVAGDDYAPIDGRGSLLAGSTIFYGGVHLVGDRIDEPDETFTYTIVDEAGEVEFTVATITIVDDDEPGSAPCVLLSESRVEISGRLSTEDRRSFAQSPRFELSNCGEGPIELAVRGTNASGESGEWELTNQSSGGPIDSICELGVDLFRADLTVWHPEDGGIGTPLTTTDTRLLGLRTPTDPILPEQTSREISPSVELPCEGSLGVGEPMTMEITLTAVVP